MSLYFSPVGPPPGMSQFVVLEASSVTEQVESHPLPEAEPVQVPLLE
jgi:hypothetical protein